MAIPDQILNEYLCRTSTPDRTRERAGQWARRGDIEAVLAHVCTSPFEVHTRNMWMKKTFVDWDGMWGDMHGDDEREWSFVDEQGLGVRVVLDDGQALQIDGVDPHKEHFAAKRLLGDLLGRRVCPSCFEFDDEHAPRCVFGRICRLK